MSQSSPILDNECGGGSLPSVISGTTNVGGPSSIPDSSTGDGIPTVVSSVVSDVTSAVPPDQFLSVIDQITNGFGVDQVTSAVEEVVTSAADQITSDDGGEVVTSAVDQITFGVITSILPQVRSVLEPRSGPDSSPGGGGCGFISSITSQLPTVPDINTSSGDVISSSFPQITSVPDNGSGGGGLPSILSSSLSILLSSSLSSILSILIADNDHNDVTVPSLGPGGTITGSQVETNGQLLSITNPNQLSQIVDLTTTPAVTSTTIAGTNTQTQNIVTMTTSTEFVPPEASRAPEISSRPPLRLLLPAILVPLLMAIPLIFIILIWYRRRKQSRGPPRKVPESLAEPKARWRESFWSTFSQTELPDDDMRPELDEEFGCQEIEGNNTAGPELHGESPRQELHGESHKIELRADPILKRIFFGRGANKHKRQQLSERQRSPAGRSMFTTVAIWPLSRTRSEASKRSSETESEKAHCAETIGGG